MPPFIQHNHIALGKIVADCPGKIYRCLEQKYEAKLKVRCHQGLLSPSEKDGVWNVTYMSDHQFGVRADFMEEAELRI